MTKRWATQHQLSTSTISDQECEVRAPTSDEFYRERRNDIVDVGEQPFGDVGDIESLHAATVSCGRQQALARSTDADHFVPTHLGVAHRGSGLRAMNHHSATEINAHMTDRRIIEN